MNFGWRIDLRAVGSEFLETGSFWSFSDNPLSRVWKGLQGLEDRIGYAGFLE